MEPLINYKLLIFKKSILFFMDVEFFVSFLYHIKETKFSFNKKIEMGSKRITVFISCPLNLNQNFVSLQV